MFSSPQMQQVNKEGMILVKAAKVGSDSFLSQVVKLVEEAMGRKPAIQRLVDKVAGYFAYAVMIAALSVFLTWYFVLAAGATAMAIIPAVAILVVACPCALGLATPTAIMVGLGKGASNGVLFKSGDAMEMLNKISAAIFDKTGTLTEGKPQVTDVIELNEIATIASLSAVIPSITGSSNLQQRNALIKNNNANYEQNNTTLLTLAAIAEKGSEHPLAKAIVNYTQSNGIQQINDINVEEFEAIPGRGITAVYNGVTIKIGNQAFIQDQNIDLSSSIQLVEKLQGEGKTTVLVSVNNSVIGIIGLLDTPKPGAKEAITALKPLGIQPIMLTGDNENTAKEIARSVGIERVYANVLPSGKVDVVTSIQNEQKQRYEHQTQHEGVAMIGDGINDAPALTAADVGIAIGSGTDVAIEAGKVVLVRDDIYDVVTAIEIARKTVSKIKQNLIYAFLYNVILIPVAATGLLYPAFAGIAMAASSVSVTMSSLTLKRWSPSSRKRSNR
ncbi:MAG: heavy metal translocating P-type ATPase [Thermoproteota archaeon]|nr:heavy metal translocating P-type ATPase [Thermoproteota archaeon]